MFVRGLQGSASEHFAALGSKTTPPLLVSVGVSAGNRAIQAVRCSSEAHLRLGHRGAVPPYRHQARRYTGRIAWGKSQPRRKWKLVRVAPASYAGIARLPQSSSAFRKEILSVGCPVRPLTPVNLKAAARVVHPLSFLYYTSGGYLCASGK